MTHDVAIVGGGPAGLTAALILGRARKGVLLADAGTPRNVAAQKVHGFVTRDGMPPSDFRRVAREQLASYPSVEVADTRGLDISGAQGRFEVDLGYRVVAARRILLCTGMIDEMPELPGYRQLWGKAIFQCPYCHGWEVQDRAFGYIAPSAAWLEWSLLLKCWSADVTAFTDGAYEVPVETRSRLMAANVRIEERAIRAVIAPAGRPGVGERLESLELVDGSRVPRDVIFARPRQRQTDLVRRLDVGLDEQGFVQVKDLMGTARPGISSAGDLTSALQTAQLAAAAGARAAYSLNYVLTIEGSSAKR